MAYTGKLCQNRVPLSGFRYMKGFSLAEVYKRVGKSVVSFCKQDQLG